MIFFFLIFPIVIRKTHLIHTRHYTHTYSFISVSSFMFPAPHNRLSGPEIGSSGNVMAHGDAREGKWRGNWRMKWVASTLHATSEHGVSRITTADAHNSAASSRLNWRPSRFKWTRPFLRKTKSCFCACAITFQKQSAMDAGTTTPA